MLQFVTDREIYTEVIQARLPQARRQLWIATADIKDLHVGAGIAGKNMVPLLQVLAGLLESGVEVRLIHAKEPGPMFRQEFDRFPILFSRLERVLCPRVHFKCIIIDCTVAYFGSANLTGAGMGAKSAQRRNFENGILTDQPELVKPLMTQFDDVWRGAHCAKYGRRKFCGDCPVA